VVHGSVGGDQHNYRALGRALASSLQLPAYRRAGNGRVAAEVGLHQHADRVAALRFRQARRGGADAALEAEGDGAGPGADGSFLDRTAIGGAEHHCT